MTDEQQSQILEVLKQNNYCVIATATDRGAPESAVIAFSETPKLEIVFASFSDTRKNVNIAKNPAVSLVMGTAPTSIETLQIEGIAAVLTGDERERLRTAHLSKNQGSLNYATDAHEVYFKVTPHWIRYLNKSNEPEIVRWEITL